MYGYFFRYTSPWDAEHAGCSARISIPAGDPLIQCPMKKDAAKAGICAAQVFIVPAAACDVY